MALPLLVSTRFQVLLTPLAGVLFAFPSRYWFTIGRQRVFSLGEWSPQFPTGLHVSGGTQDTASSPAAFCYVTLTLYGPAFQQVRIASGLVTLLMRSYNPPVQARGFGLFPFSLAAIFGISVIYFPPGTEMFHFPGLAHPRLCIQRAVTGVYPVGFLHSE